MKKVNKSLNNNVLKETAELYRKMKEQFDNQECKQTLSGKHEWIDNSYFKPLVILGIFIKDKGKYYKTFQRCAACNKIKN